MDILHISWYFLIFLCISWYFLFFLRISQCFFNILCACLHSVYFLIVLCIFWCLCVFLGISYISWFFLVYTSVLLPGGYFHLWLWFSALGVYFFFFPLLLVCFRVNFQWFYCRSRRKSAEVYLLLAAVWLQVSKCIRPYIYMIYYIYIISLFH